jgi:hypothetical protein
VTAIDELQAGSRPALVGRANASGVTESHLHRHALRELKQATTIRYCAAAPGVDL